MPRLMTVNEDLKRNLSRSFQSGSINFLLGSGVSYPSIQILGTIESEIDELLKAGNADEANKKTYNLIQAVQLPMNRVISNTLTPDDQAVLKNYRRLISAIQKILLERRSNLLPKQANIFTTNYDLFIEKASEDFPVLRINDGFERFPNTKNEARFSTRAFFNASFNTGNLYSYKVEIPCINLLKLHGSLSWKRDKEELFFQVQPKPSLGGAPAPADLENYIGEYALILPRSSKFRETLLERVYYDLLRIYANELDKENALLIAFGFSFNDLHIFDITRRALKNPTLKLLIFSYDTAATASYTHKFDGFENVTIVEPAPGLVTDFQVFNSTFEEILPERGS